MATFLKSSAKGFFFHVKDTKQKHTTDPQTLVPGSPIWQEQKCKVYETHNYTSVIVLVIDEGNYNIYISLIFPFLLGTNFNHLKHAWGSQDPVLTTISPEYATLIWLILELWQSWGSSRLLIGKSSEAHPHYNKHKRLRWSISPLFKRNAQFHVDAGLRRRSTNL